MAIRAQDAIAHYRQRQGEALEVISGYKQVAAFAQHTGAKVQAELERAAVELASAYLPGLTPENLQRTQELTGFVGFKRRDPLRAIEHERHTLNHTVSRIAADPRYVKRESIAGPDGTLGAKLEEAETMIAPFDEACAKFEVLPLFSELVRVGYDTPDFKESWWTGEYWKYWSAGDEVCSALSMDDFGDDVLPAYRKEATQRDFWRREIHQLRAELNAIHELVRHHDQAKARIPQLAQLYLAQSHEVLSQHLREADTQLLEEWRATSAPNDRALQMGLRKVSGLRAKFEILRELHDGALQTMVKELEERVQKYGRKVVKYQRPKYGYQPVAPAELDQKFGSKVPKLHERRRKLQALIERIDRYNDYERFDLHNDQELWWYELTGGKRPPQQLARWRRYYDRHPTVTPRRDKHDVPKAVQQAAAEIPQDDVGYLS